jgi:streptogramin lyase
VLANITDGVVFGKGVAFDLALMNSIPENVKVACSYQDEYYEYINSADSSGSPYTVEVGAGVNVDNYIAKDSENRICFTSTNCTYIQQSCRDSIVGNGSIILNEILWDTRLTIPSSITVTQQYKGTTKIIGQTYPVSYVPTPELGEDLLGTYTNSTILTVSTSPYIHDFIYNARSKAVWGISRSESGSNYISKIDQNGVVTAVLIGEGGANKGMALVNAYGYIWGAILTVPSQIVRINPDTFDLTWYTCAAGGLGGTGIAAGGNGHLYMTLDVSPGKIVDFNTDTETYTVIDTPNLHRPYWAVSDGYYVWAIGTISSSPFDYSTLARIDPADNSVTMYNLGTGSNGTGEISFDGHYIWCALSTKPALLRFDPATNTSLSIKFPVLAGGAGIQRVVACEGGYVWAVQRINDRLAVIRVDAVTLAVERYRTLPISFTYVHGLCYDGMNLWVGQWQASAVVARVPAYYHAVGATSIIRFDGNNTVIEAGTTMYPDTLGLTTNETVTQIPISGSFRYLGMDARILQNTFNNTLFIRFRVNGVPVGEYITVAAGTTGTQTCYADGVASIILSQGDLLSIYIYTPAATSGSANIGKINLYVQG